MHLSWRQRRALLWSAARLFAAEEGFLEHSGGGEPHVFAPSETLSSPHLLLRSHRIVAESPPKSNGRMVPSGAQLHLGGFLRGVLKPGVRHHTPERSARAARSLWYPTPGREPCRGSLR